MGSPSGELSAELTERGKRQSTLSDGTAATSPKGRGLLVQLIFKPEIISYHCDKFRIRGLSSVILNGISKIRIERIHVASVPSYLDGVAYCTLDTACGGLVFLRNGRVEDFRDAVDDVTVIDREQYRSAEILIALDVGGDTDLVNDPCDLGFDVGGLILLT